MTKNKIILHKQQDIIPIERIYHNKIDFFITSSKGLTEGTILFMTKSNVYLDFGTKPIIKVSRKDLINNLMQIYYVLNMSYMLIKRDETLSKSRLREWIKEKIQKGKKLSLNVETVDSLKNIYIINFKKTLEYVKYNKFFLEIYRLKILDKPIKGYIINNIKGGFSVVIGGLVAFLPSKELTKKPNKKLSARFVNSSMDFKISKINFKNKNVVLRKA